MGKDNQITYLFLSGRKKRLEDSHKHAKEFFYGFDYFKKNNQNTEIIEFSNNNNFLLKIFSYILIKLSDLPFFLHKAISKTNYKRMNNTNKFLLTNQRAAFSILPFLLITKIYKKIDSYVFVMGLLDKKVNYKIKSMIRDLFIKVLFYSSKNLIFLGYGEYLFAKRNYKKFTSKFVFLPFPVDSEFWKPKKEIVSRNEILFIGNDGMRDYKFLDLLVKELKEYNFTIVSKKINNSISKNPNVTLIDGSWDSNNYSDSYIHDLYKRSTLTILPLIDSLQPSGQSVTLQSISSGTPVLITKTKGFWDPERYIDNKNIFFIEKNEIKNWKERIDEIINNKKLLEKVSANGIDFIRKNGNLNLFNKKLDKIIST